MMHGKLDQKGPHSLHAFTLNRPALRTERILSAIPELHVKHSSAIISDIVQCKQPHKVDLEIAALFEHVRSRGNPIFTVPLLNNVLDASKDCRKLGEDLAWLAWDMVHEQSQSMRQYFLDIMGHLERRNFQRKLVGSLTPIPGFGQYPPEAQNAFNSFRYSIAESLRSFGAMHIQLPLVTRKEAILGVAARKDLLALSEVSDFGRRRGVVLIPEHTIQLAQYAIAHEDELSFPGIFYQLGPVFRAEAIDRPDLGRWCEFEQADLDIVSNRGLDLSYDVDIALKINEVLTKIGITDTLFRVSHRSLLAGALLAFGVDKNAQVQALIAMLDGAPCDRKQLFLRYIETATEDPRAGLLRGPIGRLGDEGLSFLWDLRRVFGRSSEVIPELRRLHKRLGKVGASAGAALFNEGAEQLAYLVREMERDGGLNVAADLSLARTCPIYSGSEIEVRWLSHPEIGSIAAGGRWGHLGEKIAGIPLTGMGMCIGITRIFSTMVSTEQFRLRPSADVLIGFGSSMESANALSLLRFAGREFRRLGFSSRELPPNEICGEGLLRKFAEENLIKRIFLVDRGELLDLTTKERTSLSSVDVTRLQGSRLLLVAAAVHGAFQRGSQEL